MANNTVIDLLLQNIENSIEIVVHNPCEKSWGKSLEFMPMFTLREIDLHRKQSGKQPGTSIIKTLERGRKFREERYISADSIYTAYDLDKFSVKGKCKASMKNQFRDIEVCLSRTDGNVLSGKCSCPAGNSSYCNHIMALLFEIADYSLNGLSVVPQEISCTSKSRQWGIPTGNKKFNEPIMASPIRNTNDTKGISSTLYDPRINFNRVDIEKRIIELQEDLCTKDKRIGFAHCINMVISKHNSTKFGDFRVGTTLSHQLLPLEHNFKVLTNIKENITTTNITHAYNKLPYKIIASDSVLIPTAWGHFNDQEMAFLESLKIQEGESYSFEEETVKQSDCPRWFELRKNRITSSKAHLIYIRKRNFEALVENLLNPKPEHNLPPTVREALAHGKLYESKARNAYTEYLKHSLKHDINVRETGLVIQPNLYWLASSPDGLVSDNSDPRKLGLVEIKCPKSKQFCTPEQILKDDKFYMHYVEGQPMLKLSHSNGYYTQIQMAMGICGLKFCDFIVYTFKGMIISRTVFDEKYFKNLLHKLNLFYKDNMLPNIVKQGSVADLE